MLGAPKVELPSVDSEPFSLAHSGLFRFSAFCVLLQEVKALP